MTGIKGQVGSKIPGLDQREIKPADIGKAKDVKVPDEIQRPGAGEVKAAAAAVAQGTAGDFATAESGQKVGTSGLNVRLDAMTTQSLDELVDSVPWSMVAVAKDLMDDSEISAFLKGEMAPADFTAILGQVQQPMAKDQLQSLYPSFDEVYAGMNADEKGRCDAGQMAPTEFDSIQMMMWERMDAAAENLEDQGIYDVGNRPDVDSAKLDKPEAQKLYKPGDIMNRVKSGKGHNVMFGGQLMDRAVLGAMLGAMQGQGDGRVSRADMQKVLPRILDAGKITTAEENAMLFGLKHCRFTKAADRELAQAIGDKFPDSAVAKFGSLGQPPRFADYQQYDLPMFANRAADLYGAKAVMSDTEMNTWSSGEMSLADFNSVLKRANKPMTEDKLRETVGEWTFNDATAVMTDSELNRLEGGLMSAAELQNIQYRGWEDESPSMVGKTPYQEDFKPGFKPFVADDTQDPKLRTLNQQLAEINTKLDAGDLDGMLEMFPQDIVQGQLDLGVTKEQFIREAFMLRGLDDLSQVEDISLDTSRVEDFGPNTKTAFGVAILKDGEAISAQVLLDNDLSLTSAVG